METTLTAADIMTSDVVTISETSSLADALDLLSDLEIRHLPVVNESGEVVGMISDRDLRALGLSMTSDLESLEKARRRLDVAVSTIMSSDVLSIEPSADATEIIDLLLEERVGAVPVIDGDNDELVGIVSYVDVLRAIREGSPSRAAPRKPAERSPRT